MLNRISWKSNFLTQITHLNFILEGRVRIAVVNIHDVDTTSFSPFFKKVKNEFLCSNSLSLEWTDLFSYETYKIIKTSESKSIIKSRNIMRREESDLFILNESFIEQFRNLNRVVKFTNSIIFSSFIILEN